MFDKWIRSLTAALLAHMATTACAATFDPTAYYTYEDEDYEETQAITDVQAPLEVTFKANPSDLDDDVTYSYEWRFVEDGYTDPFIVRYEEETTYEFRESGTFLVSLYVSYGTEEAELISTISITISTSILEMPNAFTPNGDGINDVYCAKSNHQSIVEFKAYIFNRWGHKIYEWSDIDGGWDGTQGGKPAKPGVYFVLVKAKGADGTDYNIRRDVNLIRDYVESSDSDTE